MYLSPFTVNIDYTGLIFKRGLHARIVAAAVCTIGSCNSCFPGDGRRVEGGGGVLTGAAGGYVPNKLTRD